MDNDIVDLNTIDYENDDEIELYMKKLEEQQV